MKWIKVEDKLPKIGERVLVCCKYGDELFPRIAARGYSIMGGTKWYEDDGFDLDTVTHWMYIKLPKE